MSYEAIKKKRKKLKCIFLCVRGPSEKVAYCMTPTTCMTFWKRQNYGDNKEINDFPGVKVEH